MLLRPSELPGRVKQPRSACNRPFVVQAARRGRHTSSMGRSRPDVPQTRGRKSQQQRQQQQPLALSHLAISDKAAPRVESLLSWDVFQVHGVLTVEECRRLIDAAEAVSFAHQSSRGPRFGEALRSNGRIQVQDAALAQRLWHATGLDRVCAPLAMGRRRPIGLNPNIRLYRYKGSSQHFGPHVDEAVEVGGGAWTAYTLLIYLSGGLTGGETVFYGDDGRRVVTVTPRAGLALLHAHGDACLEHEALAVARGTKYVLRSDVIFA